MKNKVGHTSSSILNSCSFQRYRLSFRNLYSILLTQALFAQLIERYLILIIQEPAATLAEHSSEEQWKEWGKCQLLAEPAAKTAKCQSSTRIVLPADLKSVCKLE